MRTQLLSLSKPCPAGYLSTSPHSLICDGSYQARPDLRDFSFWVPYSSKLRDARGLPKDTGLYDSGEKATQLMRVVPYGEKHGTQVLFSVTILREGRTQARLGRIPGRMVDSFSHSSSVIPLCKGVPSVTPGVNSQGLCRRSATGCSCPGTILMTSGHRSCPHFTDESK